MYVELPASVVVFSHAGVFYRNVDLTLGWSWYWLALNLSWCHYTLVPVMVFMVMTITLINSNNMLVSSALQLQLCYKDTKDSFQVFKITLYTIFLAPVYVVILALLPFQNMHGYINGASTMTMYVLLLPFCAFSLVLYCLYSLFKSYWFLE